MAAAGPGQVAGHCCEANDWPAADRAGSDLIHGGCFQEPVRLRRLAPRLEQHLHARQGGGVQVDGLLRRPPADDRHAAAGAACQQLQCPMAGRAVRIDEQECQRLTPVAGEAPGGMGAAGQVDLRGGIAGGERCMAYERRWDLWKCAPEDRPQPGDPFPTREAMMALLHQVRKAAQTTLDNLSEEALTARTVTHSIKKSRADFYMRAIYHAMSHLRQIWLLRGALGLAEGPWPEQHWS